MLSEALRITLDVLSDVQSAVGDECPPVARRIFVYLSFSPAARIADLARAVHTSDSTGLSRRRGAGQARARHVQSTLSRQTQAMRAPHPQGRRAFPGAGTQSAALHPPKSIAPYPIQGLNPCNAAWTFRRPPCHHIATHLEACYCNDRRNYLTPLEKKKQHHLRRAQALKVDTVHRPGTCIVTMILVTDIERTLSDDQLARIANNQHRLKWSNCSSGEAALPSRIVGRSPPGAVVARDGDHVTVTTHLETELAVRSAAA